MRSFVPTLVATAIVATTVAYAQSIEPSTIDFGRVRLSASLTGRYDDNVIQLSERDLERFERDGSDSDRFRIESASDFVTSAGVEADWTTRPFRRRNTRVGVGVRLNRFQRNAIKNFNTFSLDVTQDLTAARRKGATLRAFFDHTPSFYLRELTDDDASFAAGERIRRSATYGQSEFGVRISKEWIDRRLSTSVRYAYRDRDYGPSFEERSSIRNLVDFEVRGRPFAERRLRMRASYGIGSVDAVGDLASTPIPDDDVTYDMWRATAEIVQPWGGRRDGRISLRVGYENRDFTTDNPFDRVRFGREDDRFDVRVSVRQEILPGYDFVAEWRQLDNDAWTPNGATADDATDFEQTRVTIGVRARIGTFGRRR